MTDNAPMGDTGGGDALDLCVTVAELAEVRWIARQVMYRKVGRLVDQGALPVRADQRGVRMVSPG